MHKLSAFILTFNSEKYLEQILAALAPVCEDLVVVDSGSTDATKHIAEKFNSRVFSRKLDDFKNQRTYALEQCLHELVLMVDSDEIPDQELIKALANLKMQKDHSDAYRIRRHWYVLGKKIHAVYPVVSPDYPIRLFDKRVCNFASSPVVHEEPSGYGSLGLLAGSLLHFTFETRNEINIKLERYAALSAQTLIAKNKRTGVLQQWLSSIAAFIKWYAAKGGWKDGVTGWILGRYAFDYTFRKYDQARRLKNRK